MPSYLSIRVLAATACLLFLLGTRLPGAESDPPQAVEASPAGSTPAGMAWIPGGWFTMGDEMFADARPRRRVKVNGFWIDTKEVTNKEFAAFVAATGYVTVAERPIDPRSFRASRSRSSSRARSSSRRRRRPCRSTTTSAGGDG